MDDFDDTCRMSSLDTITYHTVYMYTRRIHEVCDIFRYPLNDREDGSCLYCLSSVDVFEGMININLIGIIYV